MPNPEPLPRTELSAENLIVRHALTIMRLTSAIKAAIERIENAACIESAADVACYELRKAIEDEH